MRVLILLLFVCFGLGIVFEKDNFMMKEGDRRYCGEDCILIFEKCTLSIGTTTIGIATIAMSDTNEYPCRLIYQDDGNLVMYYTYSYTHTSWLVTESVSKKTIAAWSKGLGSNQFYVDTKQLKLVFS